MSIHPRIVAHRGFTRDHTENTLASLAAAVALGSPAVEFDVHATLDGVWVMHHDPNLERIHGSRLAIADSTLAELRAAAPIPTLAEALAVLRPGCRPMVEVKETMPRHLDALAEVIEAASTLEPMVIVRGDLPRPARAALGDTPIYLFEKEWDRAYARRDEPIDGYDLKHDPVPDRRIAAERARFAAAGKEIAVWTINDRARAERWLDAGVEWVITDRPEMFPARTLPGGAGEAGEG